MGFGKRKRNAEPRSRDDPKRSKGEEVEGDTRKDNGIWCADNMCNPKYVCADAQSPASVPLTNYLHPGSTPSTRLRAS